jgi:hypothetical protein
MSTLRMDIIIIYESSVLVVEGYYINGTKMVIVLLNKLARSNVVLDDLFIAYTGDELVVVDWVVPNDIWRLPRRKLSLTLASLGIPYLHIAVVRGCNELLAIIVPRHIVTALYMPRISLKYFSIIIYIEEPYLSRRRRRKKKVARVGEEVRLRNRGARELSPAVYLLLRYVALIVVVQIATAIS